MANNMGEYTHISPESDPCIYPGSVQDKTPKYTEAANDSIFY